MEKQDPEGTFSEKKHRSRRNQNKYKGGPEQNHIYPLEIKTQENQTRFFASESHFPGYAEDGLIPLIFQEQFYT